MSPTLYECLLSCFGWVLHGSFMASILIVLVLILQFLFKNKLEVRWKYLLWVPVAIRLLLPWAPESSLSLYNVFSLEAIVPVSQAQSQVQLPTAWHSLWTGAEAKSEAEDQAEDAADSEKNVLLERKIEVSNLSLESGTTWDMRFWWSGFKQMGFTNMLMSVWFLGVLLFAAKTVVDQSQLKRALRTSRSVDTPVLSAVFRETKQLMGVKRDVRFVVSERIPGPAVVGFRKPAIVISPSLLVTLREDQLRCILAHEFGHIQRRDVAVNWIMHILLILHWFNPLLWLAVHKARQDQEMACDACVLDRMSSQMPLQHNHTYGQTIIHVLEHFHLSGKRHQPGLAGLSATHKQMKRRLLMIKRFHKKSYHLSMFGMAIMIALGSVTLVNAKGNDVDAAESSSAVNEIALKTAAENPKAEGEVEKLQEEEIARITALLEKNPDDTYVSYSNLHPKGDTVWGYSDYWMGKGYDKYEDYLKKASSLKESTPQQPDSLPEGYAFAKAYIEGPYGSEYKAEMKAEAEKLGKKVYSKKVNWTYTNLIQLTYTNGENYIELYSGRIREKNMKEKEYTYKSYKDMKKEYPKLDDKIMVNRLSWNENGKMFSIQTNPGNPLTKEDLIKLAKTAVKN